MLLSATAIIILILVIFMVITRKKHNYKPGIISGLITFIIIFFMNYLFTFLNPNSGLLYYYNVTNAFIGAIVGGVFWGSIFVYFYEKLPGTKSIIKSFVLGIPFLIFLLIPVQIIGYPFEELEYLIPYWISIVEAFIGFFIFGVCLGFFYDKFKKK